MLNACFPEIECHVFQNDLTFTVVEELYRYLMDSYRELVQELESLWHGLYCLSSQGDGAEGERLCSTVR